MPIVTSTYRYKPPPTKLAEITGPAIVTIDPKTRAAKKGRRPRVKELERRPRSRSCCPTL